MPEGNSYEKRGEERRNNEQLRRYLSDLFQRRDFTAIRGIRRIYGQQGESELFGDAFQQVLRKDLALELAGQMHRRDHEHMQALWNMCETEIEQKIFLRILSIVLEQVVPLSAREVGKTPCGETKKRTAFFCSYDRVWQTEQEKAQLLRDLKLDLMMGNFLGIRRLYKCYTELGRGEEFLDLLENLDMTGGIACHSSETHCDPVEGRKIALEGISLDTLIEQIEAYQATQNRDRAV